MTEGDRRGQFLFSAATVNRIREFYREVRDLPYRADGYDEVVMVDDEPYQVVDVEYWARRVGASDRRMVVPTVYLLPIDAESWQRRVQWIDR